MSPKKSFSILLVEDEAGFRRTYSDLFTHYGHKVFEAADGEEGVQLARQQKPDLILLDLVMPKLDGFGVLTKLRGEASTKDLPIIVFSVLGEQNHIQRAIEMGANDYLIKGANSPAEVLGKVGQFLAASSVSGV
jgi:DNA-binding response OmpR family regulator